MYNVKEFEDYAEKVGMDRKDWRLVAYFDESILSLESKAHFAEKDALIFKAFWGNTLDKTPKTIRKNPNPEDNYYYLQNNEYTDTDYVSDKFEYYSVGANKLA